MRTFRWKIAVFCLACLAAIVATSGSTRAAEMFDFETLRFRAKMLASKPYEPRATTVPESLRKLSYDQYFDIQYRAEQAWWRRERLPFQLQFFHLGFIHNQAVLVNELRNKQPEPIPFSTEMFQYGKALKLGRLPSSLGFAGFRLHYDLNKPGDELGCFLGASYFRMLCTKAAYGLSARGLAIDTGETTPEEFPSFEEFWVERPEPDAKVVTVYALLNGPSVAGAYRFGITPGGETVMDVKAVIYLRHNPKTLGIAPLTSMFWHGENSPTNYGDFRPEVHDSDGLMLANSSGEWLWRPLSNPAAVRAAAFADENPRGFGLMQRDRHYSSYEDLEARYHLRPSAWVEPVGNWGRGSVRLVELPTPAEWHDNIVAFWVPEKLPAPGEPIEFAYRLHWCLDQVRPPAGFVSATRADYSGAHPQDARRVVVDFDGPYLRGQKEDPAIEPVISVGEGAKLTYSTLQKNPFNGTWRVVFVLKPDGSGRPVELRCFLKKPPHVLTETWSYLWSP
jgi:glucans biosynthesis protein